MSKKKPVELTIENNLPRALIINGATISTYLSSLLTERGCNVQIWQQDLEKIEDKPAFTGRPAYAGRFDYIFQFGNASNIAAVAKKYLLPSGKFLFVQTEDAKETIPKLPIKILRIGDIQAWDIHQLTTKIMKVMFSARKEEIIDVYKKAAFPYPQKPVMVKQEVLVSDNLDKQKIKESQLKPKEQPLVKKTRLVTKKRILLVGAMLALVLIIVSSVVYWQVSLAQRTLSDFRSHFAAGNWQAIAADIKQAKSQIATARKMYDLFLGNTPLLGNTSFSQDLGGLLSNTDKILSTGEEIIAFSQVLDGNNNRFLTGTGSITKNDLGYIQEKIKILNNSVAETRRIVNETHLPFIPKEDYLSFLSLATNKLVAVNAILPLMDKFFFSQTTKVYLILFQNNMELRPTGGFIGSFGLATITSGKLTDFKIEDVYTADGQLKGHIDPPLAIRKYLSQPHYFLRDSNFDPDFARSGQQASWFLEKEIGINVDGVIGVNLFLMQKLLGTIGSLKLADFQNEEITASNFFFKAQFFSQSNFFPGSTQKKDFLTSAANAVITKIDSGNKGMLLEMLPIIKEALDEKSILLYSTDEIIQKLIENLGYGGRLTQVKCVEGKKIVETEGNSLDPKRCYPDYLAVIEANLGVNKANYFINKSLIVEKKIGSTGQLNSVVTLSYENTATREVFPGSSYVNYLRLFVPKGSSLTSITLNNVPLEKSDIDIENYDPDKTSFGMLVKIAPGNKGVVKIAYISGNISTESYYQFFYQKQGGDKVSPFVLSIIYPEQFPFRPVNFTSTTSGQNEIFYTTDTSTDRIFAFAKN